VRLNEHEVKDLNILADWLAQDNFTETKAAKADLMIVAGHAILPNIEGALSFSAKHTVPLLLSGGIGHSTELLRTALVERAVLTGQSHPYGSSEADMLNHLAVSDFGICSDCILIENASTNCGQNAEYSLLKLMNQPSLPSSILLVQDPLMQRRTYETFVFTWKTKGLKTNFISWPVFTPQLSLKNGLLTINGASSENGLWGLNRYVSMVLGEIRRLQDDENGYGPKGAGFIGHVEMPEIIKDSWSRLIDEGSSVNHLVR